MGEPSGLATVRESRRRRSLRGTVSSRASWLGKRRIVLPVLPIHFRNKLGYVAVWAPYIAAYQLVNRYPLREPTELTMTWLDRAIPFVPELLPLYVSYLLYYFWTVARLGDDHEVSRVFYATHLQLLLSLVVFVLYPVRMPRELFYTEASYGSSTCAAVPRDTVANRASPALVARVFLRRLYFR